MKQKIYENLTLIILVLGIGVLFFLWQNSSSKATEQIELVESLNAELETWKDKDSLNHARIQTIQLSSAKAFTKLQTTDSLVKDLQSVVKDFSKQLKKQGSVTGFETITRINTTNETQVTVRDTIHDTINNTKYIYPEYNSNFNLSNWVKGNVRANRDSTNLSLSVSNKYHVILGEESQGLFKKRKPFVEVINQNPYSETTSLRAFRVDDNRPKIKIGFGLYGGYGATINSGEVLVGPQIGGGLILNFNR